MTGMSCAVSCLILLFSWPLELQFFDHFPDLSHIVGQTADFVEMGFAAHPVT